MPSENNRYAKSLSTAFYYIRHWFYRIAKRRINAYQVKMENFRTYIHSLIDLSEEGWRALNPALSTAGYKKGATLLQEGHVCNKLFFVSAGYCRAFYKKGDQEVNTNFFFECEIATNNDSFWTGGKSEFSIQASENTSTIVLDRSILLKAGQENHEIATLGRLCLHQTAAKLESHASLFKLMTALERYEYLEKHHPMMLQRVPLNQLSSYLGIARETISRIRSRRS